MSCGCLFPAPTLSCVFDFVKGIREGRDIDQVIQQALCLSGSLVSLIRLTAIADEDGLEEEVVDVKAAAQEIETLLESSKFQYQALTEQIETKIWEIIIPILVPAIAELLKAWLEGRPGRRFSQT
jgi:hypothetical protein